MSMEMLLGDEAVALGALHSGIGGAFGYPGTPSTEIFEYIQAKKPDSVSATWSANEKVAYEEALGMSFVGRRAIVTMKHVGLNVAADPFMSSALTGARGGFVLAVADDPGMHSSQNEQDSRCLGDFARIPIFEPSNQQECYDMTREAFEMSERWGLPIMMRLVTRLAHSRAAVHTSPPAHPALVDRAIDWREWTLLPPNARQRYRRLLDMQAMLGEYSEHSPFNRIDLRGPKGIIACGLACNYVMEALEDDARYSILKISTYPPPVRQIRELLDHCDEVLVVEEGYAYLERMITGLLGVHGKLVRGKLSGALPPDGEMTTDKVRSALGLPVSPGLPVTAGLPARPPRLCDGCPHCDTFKAMMAALEGVHKPFLMSDIGCYTLGALPPYNAVQTCVDMGASIAMAHGAAKASAYPIVCTIGDSTFTHSGMTALIGAAREDADMTVIILDNATVAMTGGQAALATGDTMIQLLAGLGVPEDRIVRMDPLPKHHEENVAILNREIAHHGLSVIVACRPCIHNVRRVKKEQTARTAT